MATKSFSDEIRQAGGPKGGFSSLMQSTTPVEVTAPAAIPPASSGTKKTASSTPAAPQVKKTSDAEDKVKMIRVSYYLDEHYIETLKDYVSMKRMSGKTNFAQVDGIKAALKLLFEQAGNIPKRQDDIE